MSKYPMQVPFEPLAPNEHIELSPESVTQINKGCEELLTEIRRLKAELITANAARNALIYLIESIDAVECFVDLESGQNEDGDVVRACRAAGIPIPSNLAAWFANNKDEEFKEWLNQLNVEAESREYLGASTMWQDTGADAWRELFEDGMTPSEALDEDEDVA